MLKLKRCPHRFNFDEERAIEIVHLIVLIGPERDKTFAQGRIAEHATVSKQIEVKIKGNGETEMTPITPIDVFEEDAQREERRRQALGDFLKALSNQRDSAVAQVGHMAGSQSFSFVRTLKWVASDVKLATELPFLKELRDPDTGEYVIDADNIHLVRQRPVDWSRQVDLARYLVAEDLHQFPPLLLVITSAWAEDPADPAWGTDGRATKSTFEYRSIGNFDGFVELNLDSAKYSIYALDGQHRVIGIKGALEMINTGQLVAKDKAGKPKGNPILLDDWLSDDRTETDANQVPAETIGIQLIPGVIKGETIEDARRRISTVFVHVNQTAAPLKDGDLTVIDRNDGFALVAQYLATHLPFLAKNKRVNFHNNTISKRSTQITTMSTLKACVRAFLREDSNFENWFGHKGKGKTVAHRPPEPQIAEAKAILYEVWDRISQLPSFSKIETDPKATIPGIRNFKREGGEAHMLYRPIGQQALVQAIATLVNDLHGHNPSMDQIFTLLAKYDSQGGFQLDNPKNPWYGVLYNDSLEKMIVSGQLLASRLLEYMIAGAPLDKREALRREFADARKSRDGFAWDLNGMEVPLEDVSLPSQISI